jgi:hypothetical protein
MYYVSRFSRRLSKRDIEKIHEASARNNPRSKITRFLVCLGDSFFQLLEGPAVALDRLYYETIYF